MKALLGFLFVLGGIAACAYLSIYAMLYGGIMSIINNWGTDNSAVVWGFIRAFLFETGLIPGWLMIFLGIGLLKD